MEMDISMSGMEKCLIGDDVLELPQELLEYDHIFNEVFSMETWKKQLTKLQRQHLMEFLPTFPEDNDEERQETLKYLFSGENFKFGNPLQTYHKKLKSGLLSPDIAHYFELCRHEKEKEYHFQQEKYYADLLKEILEARPKYIKAINESAPDQPLKLPKLSKPDVEATRKTTDLERRTKRKYRNILKEVREECGEPDTSSEESGSESDGRVLYSVAVNTPNPCTVKSTLTSPGYSDLESGTSPEIFRVTHADYHYMLTRHKRRKTQYPHAPEFQTKGLTFEEVVAHIYPKDGGTKEETTIKEEPLSDSQPSSRKRVKDRRPSRDSKPKKKAKEIVKPLPGGDVTVIKKEASDGNMEEEVDVEAEDIQSCSRNIGRHSSFFAVIRDFIKSSEDQRITTAKLEELVKQWQNSPESSMNVWFNLRDSWTETVSSVLKYLAGDIIGMSEEFIPFVDYKERVQVWQWIGEGRDDDGDLTEPCEHWLEGLNTEGNDLYSNQQMSPPPPRWVTDYVVKPSTDSDKATFHQQERVRFDNPHRAFTYRLHGYESVVGPVKGVYSKETSLKVREHSILVKERPAYVTILTLVRDSCARMPNGEGTRADICCLMRDSMYLSDGIEDTQLNTVVSGALDRLHYEKDPCIKYDVGRKIWIYLHRGRVEEDFEKIHHAQEKAAKAKRSLMKPKLKLNAVKQEKLKTKDAAVHLRRVDSFPGASADPQPHEATRPASTAALTASTTALTTPTASLPQRAAFSRGTTKGSPNSVAGLLQKARQQPNQGQRIVGRPEATSLPQTIKQLTSTPNMSPQIPNQRLIMGQSTPMAVFLPTSQAGQQPLTFSLIPAKVESSSESEESSAPMMPISRIMQQLTKSINVSDLIASQNQKKPRKKCKKPSQQDVGNMVLSTSQRVQQAQISAPKLRATELSTISRASPSVGTISQILQSNAASQSRPANTVSTETLAAIVSAANTKPLTQLPIANTFIPIAPAELASTSSSLSATVNAPVPIAPAAQVISTAKTTISSTAAISQSPIGTASSGGVAPVPLNAQIFVQAAPPCSRTVISGTRLVAPPNLPQQTRPPPNQVQLVKTVMSKPEGHTSPTTAFLIAPSTAPSKVQKKAKSQPVYARIITPPPGLRLNVAGSNLASNSQSTVRNVGTVASTCSQEPTPVSSGTTSVQSSSSAMRAEMSPKSVLAAAIRGRAQLGVLPTVTESDSTTEQDKSGH